MTIFTRSIAKNKLELHIVNIPIIVLSCLIILSIILCDTSKASENLTFVLKQSLILSSVFVVINTVAWVP